MDKPKQKEKPAAEIKGCNSDLTPNSVLCEDREISLVSPQPACTFPLCKDWKCAPLNPQPRAKEQCPYGDHKKYEQSY